MDSKALLLYLLATFSCSSAFKNADAEEYRRLISNNSSVADCPSDDFATFFTLFKEDIKVQKQFTTRPLKQLVSRTSKKEPVQQVVETHNVKFPVTESNSELSIKRLVQEIEVDGGTASVRTSNAKTGERHDLIFKRKKCWSLIRTEDRSVFFDNTAKPWVYKLFPASQRCTPKNLYFDRTTGRSFNGFLEGQNFELLKLTDRTAQYRITGDYYGFNTSIIEIPSAEDSAYSLTILTPAERLVQRILEKTGVRVPILGPEDIPRNGQIYITRINQDIAAVHCYSFE